jgi:hypothetical protein
LRRVVREMEPGMAFAHATTVSDRIHQSVATERFSRFIFGGLSGMAVLVSIAGVWSLLVFTVLRRTREYGIRMTLGLDAMRARRKTVAPAVMYALSGVLLGELACVRAGAPLTLWCTGFHNSRQARGAGWDILHGDCRAAATGPARRVGRIEALIAMR